MKKVLLFILFILLAHGLSAQTKDVTLGAKYSEYIQQRRGGMYDYSDPETLNMKVAVWGFVKYPGKYIVPINTSVNDLLSYAGGPTDDANLDDLRLYRVMPDSTQHLFSFNFNDLLWADKLEQSQRKIPKLQGSDLLVVPGSPRLYFKDWFRLGLSIFTSVISLALLIIRIKKINEKN